MDETITQDNWQQILHLAISTFTADLREHVTSRREGERTVVLSCGDPPFEITATYWASGHDRRAQADIQDDDLDEVALQAALEEEAMLDERDGLFRKRLGEPQVHVTCPLFAFWVYLGDTAKALVNQLQPLILEGLYATGVLCKATVFLRLNDTPVCRADGTLFFGDPELGFDENDEDD